jgi:histidinol-phosphatase (PHP family)
LIDGHVHLERGPYTLDWVSRFISVAVERDITELFLLEHSHIFEELKPIYGSVIVDESEVGRFQRGWLTRKRVKRLDEYQRFIQTMRQETFPIIVKFGLEVCYFPEQEQTIRELLSNFDWDFLTGAVHWIDGWGFDFPATQGSWKLKDVDSVYERYYDRMAKLIRSDVFDHLAHPDSIKCFGHVPKKDLTATYSTIAKLLKQQKMKAEVSAGLHLNYGHPELGPNPRFLAIFKQEKVDLLPASDAHRPEDVGKYIQEANALIG